MHSCLWVDEIVRFIAAELVASGWKATTVTLACCCKALKEPALDAVWETQDQGFSPLLGTLPEGIWDSFEWGVRVQVVLLYVFHSLDHPPVQPFEGIPTELEWARLRECARRIRTLSDPGWTLSPRALWLFQFYASSEPLLPRLESLELVGIIETLAPLIPLFLSPGTASVLLGGHDNSTPYYLQLPRLSRPYRPFVRTYRGLASTTCHGIRLSMMLFSKCFSTSIKTSSRNSMSTPH